MESNKVLQTEEIVVLQSIYGHDWVVECEATKTYSVKVRVASLMAVLTVTMPPNYPAQSPPEYSISAPWMDRTTKSNLHRCMDAVYLKNIGLPTIYNWAEKIRSVLQAMKPVKSAKRKVDAKIPPLPAATRPCPPITHGDVVTDRKSSFQGHAAQVTSIEEVHAVLASLKSNKKISNAKHNMYAYRIERSSGKDTTILRDCDDDGEAHAGGRMLNLLEKMDQRNTLVVVTRWYGGIHLGPDRFRHITNATRQAIEVAGLLRCNSAGKNNKKKK